MNSAEAEQYDRVALGPNAPVYAYYAEQILASTAIREGVCLDVGCGGGYLGLALGARSSLQCIFLDENPAMIRLAKVNLANLGFSHRAETILAPVQSIPLEDGAVDLVVSRGSVPFWDNLPLAFAELHRVLRPGGQAYVGGGLGPPEIQAQVSERLQIVAPGWSKGPRHLPKRDPGEYEAALRAAGIPGFRVTRGDAGTWIQFSRS